MDGENIFVKNYDFPSPGSTYVLWLYAIQTNPSKIGWLNFPREADAG